MVIKKKILFLHHGSVPGGAPTSLKNLVTGIKHSQQFELTILCARQEMVPFFITPNVNVESYTAASLSAGRWFIWGGYNWRLIKKTIAECLAAPLTIYREYNFLKKKDATLIHLNSSILWTSAIAAFFLNIPIIWHVRETFSGGPFNVRRFLYVKFIKSLAKKVICIGPQEYMIMGGKRSKNIHFIYNSLDDKFFSNVEYGKSQIREKLTIPSGSFVYLSLGGASFRKGTFQLIESLKFVDDDFALIVAGTFPEFDTVALSWCEKFVLFCEDCFFRKGFVQCYSWKYMKRLMGSLLSIQPKVVILPGNVDDVKPFIQSCDVVVFGGTTPHSGRPVYEAWAMRKPVIVFDSDVMRLEVEDGVDGIIVKKHTPIALAAALKYLKANPALCEQMGAVGYEKAIDRFSMTKNSAKVINIYREILNENSL